MILEYQSRFQKPFFIFLFFFFFFFFGFWHRRISANDKTQEDQRNSKGISTIYSKPIATQTQTQPFNNKHELPRPPHPKLRSYYRSNSSSQSKSQRYFFKIISSGWRYESSIKGRNYFREEG